MGTWEKSIHDLDKNTPEGRKRKKKSIKQEEPTEEAFSAIMHLWSPSKHISVTERLSTLSTMLPDTLHSLGPVALAFFLLDYRLSG